MDSNSAVYPFWTLRHDHLWQVTGAESMKLTSRDRRPTRGTLDALNPTAGLREPDYDLLIQNREAAARAANMLVKRFFDPLPAGLAEALGLPVLLKDRESASNALPSHTDIVDIEALRTSATPYAPKAQELVLHRTEALLLREYIDSLGIKQPKRLRTPAGITDLHLTSADGSEVIEAKRGSTRQFVREALAQLLDYAPYAPEPAIRLTALFPSRPADHDLALLHRYGIDCVYRTTALAFDRAAAPAQVRASMMLLWQHERD
ncbi:hypothetical protein [Streptomyces sp. NPDC002758]